MPAKAAKKKVTSLKPFVPTLKSVLNSEFSETLGKICLLATSFYTSDKCANVKKQLLIAVKKAKTDLAAKLQTICEPPPIVLAGSNTELSSVLGEICVLAAYYYTNNNCKSESKKKKIIQAVNQVMQSLADALQKICNPGSDCPGTLVWCQELQKCVPSIDDCHPPIS